MNKITLSIKFLLLLQVVFFLSFFSSGQENIQFKNYTINDGLSQSVVSCIVQDKLGALWLGTQDGINRFNGKNFEVFSADKGYDISNEYVHTAIADVKGNLWFGTYNGLTKYNPHTEKFNSFQLENKSRLEIHSIAADGQNNLWIGTAFGRIYHFDALTNKFTLIDEQTFDSRIVDIRYEQGKIIVVSEFEGILITNEKFTIKKVYKPKKIKRDDFVINNLIKHPENKILIATNQGSFIFNEELEKFEPFEILSGKFSDINIVDALFLSEDRMLLATENNGLYQIVKSREDSLTVLNYTADFYQKGALIANKLNGLFQDKQGVIWIASQRGLSSFDPNHAGFKGVGFSGNFNKGLPSQNVWGFDENEDGTYLFIAADHGVTRFNRKKHHYDHYYRTPQNNEDVTTLGVHVIDKNRALVACVDGFFELIISGENSQNYVFRKIEHTIDEQRGFDKTYSIIPFFKDNEYLIGTRAGVAIYNYETREFQYIYNEPKDPESIGPGPCRLVFRSEEGRFYAAPSSGGIYEIFSNEEGVYKVRVPEIFSKLNKATRDYFTSVLQSDNHIYWFGTMGDGMYRINTKTGDITHFDKSVGLPNNVIYGVQSTLQDTRHIWLSTNRGVVAMDINKNTFNVFSEKDGLMSDELNLGAGFSSKTGEIYFGGIQGYNYFYPSEVFDIIPSLKVYFSGIEVENEKIHPSQGGIIEKSISFTDKIRLPYQRRSLKLRFFADNLSNPERIEYKYILKGDDEIEEELGSSNELRFASLAPGDYELLVYARTINGEWSTTPARLIISVEVPFWMTWWFYLIIGLVIIYFSFRLVRKSIDKERRQQVKLELKIAERTKELRYKTEKIEQQKEKLEEQTKELEKEKEKSERLLNNLLPKETASQLKQDGRSAARDFNMVSVMFTDFVGFTKIAEDMKAKDLVSILDKYFRKFDEITEKHDLEKIKTIGDAYMCAGGVPIRNKTNPINTVLAAIEIQNYMRQQKELSIAKGNQYWKLRIGINTGAVSAGVIGTKRYAYDVWGSTVNRAQRMERMCEPEKIAITESTFEHIEPYFECISKGRVTTKSGLKILMYEVISIKPELSVDGLGIEPNEAFHKLVNLHHFSKINYYKAERFILSKLKKELSLKLHYHSYDHSKDVTRQAERIAIGEGITDEDLFLLKSAASYHDAGFIEQYEKNEPIGARMAEEILPNFGYSKAHIERIKELIYVTQIPHQPKNKLEEIICDADLDYLGRDDFHEISDKLRLELREHGKINSDRKWDEIQVSFFNQHRYFTRTSIETRRAKKLQNLEDIKERIKRNEYKD
ncbi:MAG: adenylate/guanylate cyclase domain-containing protein [Brumimicrobium sp.]|nr:adenylate/guanylate cyclase domain-containing protein [Brumimicrobium sp.]